jgi:hypothetical protein
MSADIDRRTGRIFRKLLAKAPTRPEWLASVNGRFAPAVAAYLDPNGVDPLAAFLQVLQALEDWPAVFQVIVAEPVDADPDEPEPGQPPPPDDLLAVVAASGVRSGAAFLALEPVERHLVVPGLFIAGASLFAGPPKSGKSRLMLAGALAKAIGLSVLGYFTTAPAPVLYLSLEEEAPWLRAVQEKITGQLTGQALTNFLANFSIHDSAPTTDGDRVAGSANPVLAEKMAEWKQRGTPLDLVTWLDGWMRTHPATELVVIDNYWAAKGLEYDKRMSINQAEYAVLQRFRHFADAWPKCAVVIVGHDNKVNRRSVEDAFDRISGTRQIPGAVHGMLFLDKLPVEEFAADGAPEPGTLWIRHRSARNRRYAMELRDPGIWTCLGNATETALTGWGAQVVEYVKTADHATPGGFAKEVGMKSPAQARTLFLKLEGEGRLAKRTGPNAVRGEYVLPSQLLSADE